MDPTNRGVTSPARAREASGTAFVYVAAVFAALGGLLFGYDTGVISGAVIFIKKDFALSTFPQELVVSVVLAGAAIGALTGGRLADALGRRLTLLGTSLIFIAGAILCAAARPGPEVEPLGLWAWQHNARSRCQGRFSYELIM